MEHTDLLKLIKQCEALGDIEARLETLEEKILTRLEEKFSRAARMAELNNKKSLTPDEAAELFGYKATTLRNWRHQGRGPKFIRDGRLIIYRPKDIEQYQEMRCVRTRDHYR